MAAAAIRARGAWIQGLIDPQANGRDETDGFGLIRMYRELGLDLCRTDNPLETGVLKVCQRMSAGRLRVFRSLAKYLDERRLYRRDGNKWHREIPQETCEAAGFLCSRTGGDRIHRCRSGDKPPPGTTQ